uniref:Putative salivary lipocalin lipocalin n=1 Tax=Ixodes ricinus TaxID=34613 RepID=A0A6B0U3S2_IXORI
MHFRKAVRVRCALLEYYAVYPSPAKQDVGCYLFVTSFPFSVFLTLSHAYHHVQLSTARRHFNHFFALKALAGFDTVNSHSRKRGSCVVMYEKLCL